MPSCRALQMVQNCKRLKKRKLRIKWGASWTRQTTGTTWPRRLCSWWSVATGLWNSSAGSEWSSLCGATLSSRSGPLSSAWWTRSTSPCRWKASTTSRTRTKTSSITIRFHAPWECFAIGFSGGTLWTLSTLLKLKHFRKWLRPISKERTRRMRKMTHFCSMWTWLRKRTTRDVLNFSCRGTRLMFSKLGSTWRSIGNSSSQRKENSLRDRLWERGDSQLWCGNRGSSVLSMLDLKKRFSTINLTECSWEQPS